MKKIMVTMADVPLDWDEVDHSSLRLVYHETRRILNQTPLTHQSFLAVTGAEVKLLITFTVGICQSLPAVPKTELVFCGVMPCSLLLPGIT